MVKFIISEVQKLKRTFSKKLIWLAPLVTLLLSIILGVGDLFQNGAYNWWYVMFLPASLSIIASTIVEKDKKLKYSALFTLPFSKDKLWFGKIISCSYIYLITSFIFSIGIFIGGLIFVERISLAQNFIATIVLFITFLWQIPFCMFLADRFGMIVTILINIICNIIGVVMFANSAKWSLNPFAIPSRLMCPILNILPNGLPVEEGSTLLNSNVIIPGIIITVIWLIVFTVVTSIYFKNREGR